MIIRLVVAALGSINAFTCCDDLVKMCKAPGIVLKKIETKDTHLITTKFIS